MNIIIGSARIGENGRTTGGVAGDQKQFYSISDIKGEVSMQSFYVHSKGWYIIRPKNINHANKIAEMMKIACNNSNLGYNQRDRYGVIKNGIQTKVKTNCDCSSLVRECVKESTGIDPGDFNTSSEWSILNKTGLFDRITYVSQSSTPIYNGDILVTKRKGHTVIVVSGNPRLEASKPNPNAPSTQAPASYSKKQFIKDVQSAIGAQVDGIAGPETLSKTITVSKRKNRKHEVVRAIQKYLNFLGFNCGVADGVAGIKFDNAVKQYQKSKNCIVDGEITARKNTWKSLLGLR